MAWKELSAAWPHEGIDAGGIRNHQIYVNSTASTTKTRIYKGSIIIGTDDGYAENGGSGLASGDCFLGIAAADVTWKATDSNVYVPVWTTGAFWLYHDGAAKTDLYAAFEVANNNATHGPVAVDDYGTTEIPVGIAIDYYDSGDADMLLIDISGVAGTVLGLKGWNETEDAE